jgi:hypothetical protein
MVKNEIDWTCEEERVPCGACIRIHPYWRLRDTDEVRHGDPREDILVACRRDRPSTLILWEPLRTWAPARAQPYVWGLDRVSFYVDPVKELDGGVSHLKISECFHMLTGGFGDHWIDFADARFVLGTGRVVWRARWWFRFWARAA